MVAATTQLCWLADRVFGALDDGASQGRKVLICGEWEDVAPLLNWMSAQRPTKSFMSRLIVATELVDQFIDHYLGKEDIHIVDWSPAAYDEQVMERVLPRTSTYTIPLVIDFEPSLYRLLTIRKFLDMNGVVIIPHEPARWRIRYPAMMQPFLDSDTTLVKLDELSPFNPSGRPYLGPNTSSRCTDIRSVSNYHAR